MVNSNDYQRGFMRAIDCVCDLLDTYEAEGHVEFKRQIYGDVLQIKIPEPLPEKLEAYLSDD